LKITFLHTGDLHGKLTPEKAARIRELKASEECPAYFDTGDCLREGNLAILRKPASAWALLAEAGCDLSVLGNRETHVRAGPFRAKLAGAQHPVLCANLRDKSGAAPLPATARLEICDVRIGVIGVMVPMVTERMASKLVSEYLWDPPIPTLIRLARGLRPDVDCLVALTHIGLKLDLELAERCPELDLILGGHSHDALEEPRIAGGVPVCHSDAWGRRMGRYVWDPERGITDARLLTL
jgi:2',3'-cyclic-nucleotide 2'-phosphodiesterase (5'-nucleotidase family)